MEHSVPGKSELSKTIEALTGLKSASLGSLPKPTIGRIVLFRHDSYSAAMPEGFGNGNVAAGDLSPAIIVAVHSDTEVNLQVFSDGPYPLWMLWVKKLDNPTSSTAAGWLWPFEVSE